MVGCPSVCARRHRRPILFFGGFWVLATFGMVHIDNQRRANADDAWRAFEAETGRTPFKAILQGRRTLVMSDVG